MQRKLESIQVLRAVAASLVVLFHTQMLMHIYEGRYGLPPSLLTSAEGYLLFGQCGVDIFFVISGFVMAYITFDNFGLKQAAIPFLRRRIARIVPAYWFFTSIMAFLLFSFPNLFSTASFDLRGLIFSYLFIPYTPSSLNSAPILAVGWTLSYEFYFYILIALGLIIFTRKQFLIGMGCFFLLSIFLPLPFNGPIIHLISNPLLLEFYAGFLIGTAYKNGVELSIWAVLVCLVGGIVLFILGVMEQFPFIRIMTWGLPSALLLAGSVFGEKSLNMNWPRWLLSLGDGSYSLYLSHPLLLPGIGKVCVSLGFFTWFSPTVFIVFAWLICCAAGHFFYLFVEKPLIKMFSHVPTWKKQDTGKLLKRS